jgi:hypothetical protein
LPSQQPLDGVLDALVDGGVHGEMRAGGQIVDV